MTLTRSFFTTAFLALFAAGAYVATWVGPKVVAEAAVTADRSDRVAAARSAERSYEHRESPPKHLVAVRRCEAPELVTPTFG